MNLKKFKSYLPLILLASAAISASAHSAEALSAQGAPKVFKGPEGQKITLLELSDDARMLVKFENVGGTEESKAIVYQWEHSSPGREEVFFEKKKGSKMKHIVLLAKRENHWIFAHPSRPGIEFDLKYSEEESKKIHLEDLLKQVTK